MTAGRWDFQQARRERSNDEMRANLALRCAWLREHGRRLFDLDGQLAAQLADFADLLEVADELGWFQRPGAGVVVSERRPGSLPDREHLQRRVLKEALREASATYWRRRAEEFLAARHRPGIDTPGEAATDELSDRSAALTELAETCRGRAEKIDDGDLESALDDALEAS